MYGIVFCDAWGTAWKAFRYEAGNPRHLIFLRDVLEEEYEWLRAAAGTSIADSVAKVMAMHPEHVVLERECVQGWPGGWSEGKRLRDLHAAIEKAMEPLGWTAPEFKENSYIIGKNGTPTLVDISMAQRLGMNLVRYVEEVLTGTRTSPETWHDHAFFILREIPHKTIPDEVARHLVQRLVKRDPSIAKSFSLPKAWGVLV
jgi:hypothetical protein